MVVDDAVLVAVHTEDPEVVVEQHGVAQRVDSGLFLVADDLGLERVADVDTEGGVPVRIGVDPVVDPGNTGSVARAALAAVDDDE